MERIAITNATLFDCTGSDPIPNAAVLVEEDKILAAGRQSEVLPQEGDFRSIDAGGGMLLPGFIDSHVHLMMEYVPLEQRLMTPFSYGFYRAIPLFQEYAGSRNHLRARRRGYGQRHPHGDRRGAGARPAGEDQHQHALDHRRTR